MDSTQKKLIANALRASMQFLAIGRNDIYDGPNTRFEYTCYAIQEAVARKLIDILSFNLAGNYIRSKLKYHTTLDGWIKDQYPELEAAIDEDRCAGGKRMQQTRVAWIWSMICELED